MPSQAYHQYSEKPASSVGHSSRPRGWLLASVTVTPLMCIAFLTLAWYSHFHQLGFPNGIDIADAFIASLATNAVVIWNALAMIPIHVVVSRTAAGEWIALLEKGEKHFKQINRISSVDFGLVERIKAVLRRQTSVSYTLSTITLLAALLSSIVAPGAFSLRLVRVTTFTSDTVPTPGLVESGVDLRGDAVSLFSAQHSVNELVFFKMESLREISLEHLVPFNALWASQAYFEVNLQATYDTDVVSSFQYSCDYVQPSSIAPDGSSFTLPNLPVTLALDAGQPDSFTLQETQINDDGNPTGTAIWIAHFGNSMSNTTGASIVTVNGQNLAFIQCVPNYSIQRATVFYDSINPLVVSLNTANTTLVGNIPIRNFSDISSYGLAGFKSLASAPGFNSSSVVANIFNGAVASNAMLPMDTISQGMTTLFKESSLPYFVKLGFDGTNVKTVGVWTTIGLGTFSALLQLSLLTIAYGVVCLVGVLALCCKWHLREPLTLENVLIHSDSMTTQATMSENAEVQLVHRTGKAVLDIRSGSV